jgi:hypothetical protein
MSIFLFGLAWVGSFFGSFLFLQAADRKDGCASTGEMVFNLLISSIPFVNVFVTAIWWLAVYLSTKERND